MLEFPDVCNHWHGQHNCMATSLVEGVSQFAFSSSVGIAQVELEKLMGS